MGGIPPQWGFVAHKLVQRWSFAAVFEVFAGIALLGAMVFLVGVPASAASEPASASLLLRDILAETERRTIRPALEQEKWNRTRAAARAGHQPPTAVR